MKWQLSKGRLILAKNFYLTGQIDDRLNSRYSISVVELITVLHQLQTRMLSTKSESQLPLTIGLTISITTSVSDISISVYICIYVLDFYGT